MVTETCYFSYKAPAFEQTETIDSRLTEALQSRYQVGFGGKPTVATFEPEAFSASSVALITDRASCRGIRGAFTFKPNPALLAPPCQQICDIGVKPVRHPSVETARKLSASSIPCRFQILDTERLDSGKIDLFYGLADKGFNLVISVFLSSSKLLNSLRDSARYPLTIREDRAVFVVRIHANDSPLDLERRSWLFKDKINKQSQ